MNPPSTSDAEGAPPLRRPIPSDACRRAEPCPPCRSIMLEGINRIFEAALHAETEEELGEACLAVAEELTGSAFGFIGELVDSGVLNEIAVSGLVPGGRHETGDRTVSGDLAMSGLHHHVLSTASTLLTNDPASHSAYADGNEGRPPLESFLGVPLTWDGKVFGLIAFGNRSGGYEPTHLRLVEALAPIVLEALLRKRTVRDLAASRRREAVLARMLDASSQPFAAALTDGTLIEFNPAFEQLTGYATDELTRLSWSEDLTPAEWRATGALMLDRQRTHGGPIRFEQELLRKDGTRVPVEVCRSEYRNERGEVDFLYAFFNELSERKAAEEKLLVERREIGLANQILALLVNEAGNGLYDRTLDLILEATGSRHGVFGYIDELGDLICPTMSRMFADCEMGEADKCIVYKQEKWGGLWAEAIRARTPLVRNDEAIVPAGHLPIHNNLAVPILFRGEPIGLLNLANREGGYADADCEFIANVADRIAPVLYGWIQRELRRQEQELAAQARESYLDRLEQLLDVSRDVLAARTRPAMLRKIAEAARSIIGARYATCGHGYQGGEFCVEAPTRAGDAPPCPEGTRFILERGGVYLDLLEKVESLRLSDEELRSHESWTGPPAGHAVLRGLLGARLTGHDDEVSGIVLLTDKEHGEFTQEDELLLRQLASIASLGLRHIEARQVIDDERQRLRTIIDEIPIGITLLDGDGAVLEMNAAATSIWGWSGTSGDDAVSNTKPRMYRHGDADEMERHDWPMARTLRTGRPTRELVDIDRPGSGVLSADVRVLPLHDGDGNVSRILGITEDVTQHVEASRLSEALNDISATISATLEFDEILRRMIALSANVVGAETASITLRDGDAWVLWDVWGMPREIVGTRVTDDEVPITLMAAKARKPIAVNDASDPRVSPELMRTWGLKTLMAVPLIAQGRVLGTIAFHQRSRAVPFTDAEVDFAQKLMSVVTLALDNALLYERERRIADALQEAVLSRPLPIPGMEAAFLYRPASATANVGGDFYDLFPLDAAHVAIVVGDVSGKGVDAARLTSLVRDGVRAYAYESSDPSWILERVNRLVYRSSPVEAFATLFLGVLDVVTGELAYCSAGHPPPIIVGGGVDHLRGAGFGIVGAFDGAFYRCDRLLLEPGDMLVLYTDGITESRADGELFGEARLLDALEGLRGAETDEVPERLLAKVLEYTGGKLQDDTVVMCVRWLGEDDAEECATA